MDKKAGTFNVERFYQTLARIISKKEGVTVTVTVTQKEEVKKSA